MLCIRINVDLHIANSKSVQVCLGIDHVAIVTVAILNHGINRHKFQQQKLE